MKPFALLLGLAPLLAACGDAPAPAPADVGPGSDPTTAEVPARAPSGAGGTGPAATAPTTEDDPGSAPAAADPLAGSLRVSDATGWTTGPLPAFLVRRGDRAVVVTARSLVDPTPGDLEPLPLERWEERGVRAEARFGALRLTLGPPACAGLDHWSSDVLMLAAEPLPDGLEPVAVTRRVPAPGEPLRLSTGPAGLTEVFADGFLELAPVDPDRPPAAGTPVLDDAGQVLAVVSDTRERDGALRIGAQLLLPFLDTPPRLAGRGLGRPTPPLQVGEASRDGRLLAAATPPLRLIVVDLERGAPFEPLAGLDAGGVAGAATGFGLGAFPDEGFSFVAIGSGRSALFEVASGIPLAEVDAPRGAPRAVHTRGARAALTSSEELVVLDLTDFSVARRLPGSFGPVHLTDEAVLVGAFDRVLRLEPTGDAAPTVVAELGPRPDGSRPLVTALASDGSTLWIGTDRSLASVPDDGGRHAARPRLDTGRGAVNVIRVDGPRLWLGTGAPAQGPEGELVHADCYVRVLATADGRELARSHDHAFPVRALFPAPEELFPAPEDPARPAQERSPAAGPSRTWIGVSAEGETFAWRAP